MKKIFTLAAIFVASAYLADKTYAQYEDDSYNNPPVHNQQVAPDNAYGDQYYDYNQQQPYFNDNRFYYYPDYDMYYDLAAQQYVYFNVDLSRWIWASILPDWFYGFDFWHSRRYFINEMHPFMRGGYYRNLYGGRDFYANRVVHGGGYVYNAPRVIHNNNRAYVGVNYNKVSNRSYATNMAAFQRNNSVRSGGGYSRGFGGGSYHGFGGGGRHR